MFRRRVPRAHSGFLIYDSLPLDAGTAGSALNQEEQRAIEHILAHCHMDHVSGGSWRRLPSPGLEMLHDGVRYEL